MERRCNAGTKLFRPVWLLAAALAAALPGCDDTVSPGSAPGAATREAPGLRQNSAPSAAAAAGETLARGLALALNEPSARAQLRKALRRSGFNEHKLVLQEFLATNEGEKVLRAAASASGMSAAEMSAVVAKLPEMDVYLPVLEHRLKWKGTEDLAVGATLDIDSPILNAFTPTGARLVLDSRAGVPARTVLILHPAEPKSLRPGPEPGGEGETVQDASEQDGAITYSGVRFNMLNPSGGGGGGGGGVVPKLASFRTYILDGWGASEVKFRNMSSTDSEVWSFRKDGVYPGLEYTVDAPTTFGAYVRVDELDGWFTLDDDNWGHSTGYAPSGSYTAVIGECGQIYRDGDWRAECNRYGTLPDALASQQPIRTTDVKFTY